MKKKSDCLNGLILFMVVGFLIGVFTLNPISIGVCFIGGAMLISKANKIDEIEKQCKDFESQKNETKIKLNNIKKEIENKEDELQNLKNQTIRIEIDNELKIDRMRERYAKELHRVQEESEQVKEKLQEEIDNLKDINIEFEENVGILEASSVMNLPNYNMNSSEGYKKELKVIREQQKTMIKNKTAVEYSDWVVNGSKKDGRKLTNFMIKLVLRCFNVECDNVILKVKFSNYDSCIDKLFGVQESINKISNYTNVAISNDYLQLKLKELELAFCYEQKKQEEKEEQQAIREQMKLEAEEEKRREQEIQEQMTRIEKDSKHFNKQIKQLEEQIVIDPNEDLLREIEELKAKLKENEEKKKEVEHQKVMPKAGYVYVISNEGSFNKKDRYKIGMTRRLVPEERIRELSNASVPFPYDIHAMIFSEDCPKLENDIHRLLDDKRVNKVNNRKEFFDVTLEEVEEIVTNLLGKEVQFTKIAEAQQYRESLNLGLDK